MLTRAEVGVISALLKERGLLILQTRFEAAMQRAEGQMSIIDIRELQLGRMTERVQNLEGQLLDVEDLAMRLESDGRTYDDATSTVTSIREALHDAWSDGFDGGYGYADHTPFGVSIDPPANPYPY